MEASISKEMFWHSLKCVYSSAGAFLTCVVLRTFFGVNIGDRGLVGFGTVLASLVVLNWILLVVDRRNEARTKQKLAVAETKQG